LKRRFFHQEDRSKNLELGFLKELRLCWQEFADEYPTDRVCNGSNLDCKFKDFAEISFRIILSKPEVRESEEFLLNKGKASCCRTIIAIGWAFLIPNDYWASIILRQQIMILTGPIWLVKSIIWRQTGLIVLLAQVEFPRSCRIASIGLSEYRFFTRVGASEISAAGESTFLVEENEAANILNNATPRSLILQMKFGRGPVHLMGLVLLWSFCWISTHHSPCSWQRHYLLTPLIQRIEWIGAM